MKKIIWQYLVRFFIAVVGIVALFLVLFFTGIIWHSPDRYTTTSQLQFTVPIMNMHDYDSLGNHRRPYIYSIYTSKGNVTVAGIDHTRDKHDPQLDSIDHYFMLQQPDVVLIEGLLGFLFSWFQDPVAAHGESGYAVALAKDKSIPFYSWEPSREEEVRDLGLRFTPLQLAAFYSLRPYFSNYRFGKPADPDAVMQQYINERTAVEGLHGTITSVAQIDSIWKKDFSLLKDWRETSDEYGWPAGWLSDIFNASNLYRDEHLCTAITELVKQGKHVFVTMGSSHAFRIEAALRHQLSL